jgi:hypothetical protein
MAFTPDGPIPPRGSVEFHQKKRLLRGGWREQLALSGTASKEAEEELMVEG